MNTTTEKISILIADDHTLIRQAWYIVLNNDSRFKVVAQCSSGEEAIEKAKQVNPDVIIMDINLPGISGFEATKRLTVSSPGSKILAASQHAQAAYVSSMLEAGARGYITKGSEIDEMCTAILEIHKGRKYICREIKNKLAEELLYGGDKEDKKEKKLSQREKVVVDFIRKGVSSKEMAESLHISKKTVEVHRYNILRKLNLKNSPALVNYINENPTMLWR